MNTAPVVFMFFNRPVPTLRVFEQIRRARPRRLHLVSDGPRPNKEGEAAVVDELRRRIVAAIDWDVEVSCDFSAVNLGCSKRVASGIGTALSKEEWAIILEDDCLPSPVFFEYASLLLERHAGDPEYMAVSGTNLEGITRRVHGYGKCHFPMIWGWATWARAWSDYQRILPKDGSDFLDDIDRQGTIPGFLCAEWKELYQRTAADPDVTWDYQFIFHCLRKGGVATFPRANLISNIGFGPEATHTRKMGRFDTLRSHEDLPRLDLVPDRIDAPYDHFFQWEYLFGKTTLRSLPFKVRYKLHEWFHSEPTIS